MKINPPIFILALFGLCLTLYSCTTKAVKEGPKDSVKVVSNKWMGKWTRDSWQSGAELNITSVDEDSITFTMFASSGANSGELEGKAAYNNNTAVFSYNEEYDSCLIEFQLSGDSIISVDQKRGMCSAGNGVTYSGTYINSKHKSAESTKELNLVELEIFKNNKEDSAFRALVGSNYPLFVNSTQFTSEDQDLDSLQSRVYSSGVRGLYTFMENIIMIDSLNNIWAAVIDDQKVLYFTNRKDFSDSLPKTINNWRERFEEYEVVYKSKE